MKSRKREEDSETLQHWFWTDRQLLHLNPKTPLLRDIDLQCWEGLKTRCRLRRTDWHWNSSEYWKRLKSTALKQLDRRLSRCYRCPKISRCWTSSTITICHLTNYRMEWRWIKKSLVHQMQIKIRMTSKCWMKSSETTRNDLKFNVSPICSCLNTLEKRGWRAKPSGSQRVNASYLMPLKL